MTISIQYRPLASLVKYTRNSRRHPPEQIAKLKASLKEFGWARPIAIADGVVVYGHGVLQAAMELQQEGAVIPRNPDPTMGPTVDLSDLSPAQRRAYVITDNQTALSSDWDDDLLRAELGELGDMGFDMSLTGFDPSELDHVLNGWAPDMTRINRHDAELTVLEALVKVRCKSSDVQRVVEAIQGALRAAAIEGADVVE